MVPTHPKLFPIILLKFHCQEIYERKIDSNQSINKGMSTPAAVKYYKHNKNISKYNQKKTFVKFISRLFSTLFIISIINRLVNDTGVHQRKDNNEENISCYKILNESQNIWFDKLYTILICFHCCSFSQIKKVKLKPNEAVELIKSFQGQSPAICP